MPINDPIRRGKVAPASLAFENRRQSTASASGANAGTGDVTYQTFVTNQYRFGSTINVNVRAAEDTTRSVMRAMSNAEHRAKHYASDWHHAFEWDSGTGTTFAFQATANPGGFFNLLKLPNEVVRSVSAENRGNQWRFQANADATGIWLISAFVALRVPLAAGIDEAWLGVSVTGYSDSPFYRWIDLTNAHHTDKANLNEIPLQGTVLVPMKMGNELQVGVQLRTGGGTSSGTLSESQYYAYVNGVRVRCDSDLVNTPTAGSLFDNAI